MSHIPCTGTRHRMPVAFGPSPGPRQGPQGQRFDMGHAPRSTAAITFLTDERKLRELLPPGCSLDGEPLRHHLAASWDGHTFIRMSIGDLQEAPPPGPSGADGLLVHRYLPGMDPQGPAAVDEMAMSPFRGAATRYLSYQRGSGAVEFIASTWEQLPTMFHVVNTLAALPVRQIRSASVSRTRGASDLGDTRGLR